MSAMPSNTCHRGGRTAALMLTLSAMSVVLLVVDIAVGSVGIPVRDVVASIFGGDVDATTARIVVDIRLIRALVAVMAGIGMAMSGLQMQTLFRNPLAGPYVLGVSAGASLAVALFILGAPAIGLSVAGRSMGMTLTAWIGAGAVLVIVAAIGQRIKDIMVILVLGMMISSGVSAVVQILQYLSAEDALKSFVVWTMGSLGNVTARQLPVMGAAVAAGVVLSVFTVKPLNMLLFGEEYARTMGLEVRRSRLLIFTSTTMLAGTITAFCGPIGFIGLALPHVARALFATSNHGVLLPGSALIGAVVMLGCDIVSKLFTLPVNAITALVGIPVVIWIIVKNKAITV